MTTTLRSLRGGLLAAGVFAVLAGLTSTSHAVVLVYTTTMSGPNESPPNASPGIGTSTVTIDTTLNTMRVEMSFSGLLGNTTVAHIHGATLVPFTGTAGVMTQTPSFSGLPVGVTSGSMDQTFDLTVASTFNPAFVTANGGTLASATAAFISAMDTGRAYFNLHSSQFGGGEIRGFYVPTPGALGLAGAWGLVALRRRR